MKRLIFLPTMFFAICLLLFSCKKKDGENKHLNNDNKRPFDIMSTKAGSWWLYKADDGSVFYRYATGTDSLVEGLTYDYFYRVDTTSVMKEHIPEYFGKNDDKYISLIDLDGSQKSYITYVVLKDYWHKGQSWTNTENRKIQGWNLNLYIESEVMSISDTLTLNGKVYDSVILVHNDLKAKSVVMPAYIKCGTLDVWFKKGVGILQEKGDINVIGLLKKNYSDYLLDYHIEP